MEDEGKNLYEQALCEAKKNDFDVAYTLRLLNASMEAGSADAAYALASWYLHGHNVEQAYDKAIFLLKKAIKGKIPDAYYELALCYENGEGVTKNERKAFLFYIEAALRGETQSMFEVGRCYAHGIGVEKDLELADIWLSRAEELGID